MYDKELIVKIANEIELFFLRTEASDIDLETFEKFKQEKNRDLKTAYHEAGHFIQHLIGCGKFTKYPDIIKISIESDDNLLGVVSQRPFMYPMEYGLSYSQSLSEKNKELFCKRIQEDIKIHIAGFASEFIYLQEKNGDLLNSDQFLANTFLKDYLEIEFTDNFLCDFGKIAYGSLFIGGYDILFTLFSEKTIESL